MGCAQSSASVHIKVSGPGGTVHYHGGAPRAGGAGGGGLPPVTAPLQAKQGSMMVKVPVGAKPGQLLQMQTPDGQKIQCQVPHGLGPDRTFQVQYQLKRKSNSPNVIDEEDRLKSKTVAAHILPSYWTNVQIPDNDAFDQMIYVDSSLHETFNKLLEVTYREKATQDRKCPKRFERERCPKTPGGCPCVNPGGVPGLPTGYRVRRVVRVEDSGMWADYVAKREQIAVMRELAEEMPQLEPAVISDEAVDEYSNTFEPLERALNEVYLWHGTNVRAALSIAQNDFSIDLAGSNTGTMYGRGAYLAEHCTKADEYAVDEPGGYYEGVYALLLCRVCLGKFYYTKVRDQEAGAKVKSGEFDSTVGDRLAAADTFREFVVYDADQIYPEYVVLYSRVHAKDSKEHIERLTKVPYHLQLPVYWMNCHVDPVKKDFHDQVVVGKHTVATLQSLVDFCFKGAGSIKVLRATRVENSSVWRKYVDRKKLIQTQLSHGHRAGHLDHQILTKEFLRERGEESISVRDLQEEINEHLLWHGTSKAAAQKIAKDDFHIPTGKDMKHAARFGNGAYLAEEVEKSLTYAEPDPDGIRWVLLCRTIGGDFYYTEEHTRIDANQLRDQAGKHSVLANPEGKGPREFIVPTSEQVYPEFILELKVENWTRPDPVYMKRTKMQIEVPHGVTPGAMMLARLPDGREVQVQVPVGARPGMKLEIEV